MAFEYCLAFGRLDARASESAIAALRFRQGIDLLEYSRFHTGEDRLGDPVPTLNVKDRLAVIDQDDAYNTPISAVDGPRRIEDRYPVLQRQARPGTDLNFVAARNRDPYPSWNQPGCTGLDVSRHGAAQVCASIVRMRIRRPLNAVINDMDWYIYH